MSLPQIVIDTNVIVSGLRSRSGYSHRFRSLVGTGRIDIHLSVPLVLEYEEVLLREKSNLSVNRELIEDVIDYHSLAAKRSDIFYLWRPLLDDPDDELVLELAVRAECDAIVTYNRRDFRGIEQFGIRTVEPREFLQEIGDSR